MRHIWRLRALFTGTLLLLFRSVSDEQYDRRKKRQPGKMCTALPSAVSGIQDGKRLNNEQTAYALSSKDMCTVEILPEIIEAVFIH